MRTRELIDSRITKSEGKKIRISLNHQIFNIDRIWDKTEWKQVNNLFLKLLFNSLLFGQPTHIQVSEEVQAANWMRGMYEVTNANRNLL